MAAAGTYPHVRQPKGTTLKDIWKLGTAVVAVSLMVSGCSSSSKSPKSSGGTSGGGASSSSSGSAGTSGGKKAAVAYMVAGTLGDLGFFDSGKAGIDRAQKELGASTKIVEGGSNATATWKSDLQNLSNNKYGLVITGSDQVTQQLTAAAKQNPKQKFIMFDQTVNLPNVASITYRQNDGAFLAGVLAGLVTKDKKDFTMSSGSKNVGIVGGTNIPVINDFIVGFKKGVQVVDPTIKVQTSYVGSFTDAQTGYNQAASMYAAGADVVFAAAGGSGLGVLKASQAKNKYSIGVDSNQNKLYPKNVLASDLKNVGNSLFDLIKKYQGGSLQYGHTYVYGIQNGGVQLVENSGIVPATVSAKIKTYSDQVSSGKVKVPCVAPFCGAATS